MHPRHTMGPLSIQEILPFVEKPSRYLGTEINRVVKDSSKVRLRMALAFPDLYEIGTSHFGMQILYTILNQHPKILADRVYAPGRDWEDQLLKNQASLTSLETRKPLNKFDIIGFSLLYELNYTNVLAMLDLAGIPFFSKQRPAGFPLIIAGGPCTCNPEPVADFFDAMVVGDGEEVIMEMSRAWLRCQEKGESDKAMLLKTWSRIKGVYIPSFFKTRVDSDGFQHTTPLAPDYPRVTRTVVSDLDSAPFPRQPIVPYGKPIHDRLRLEVSRGCTRGCRFCQAGMIYRPLRERSPKTLFSICDDAVAATGYEDISLLSLSTSDYTCIQSLLTQLMNHHGSRQRAVSLPSFRAGTLSPELMALIKKVRKTGFTIAPEAGSQRLRDVINKNISSKDIYDTVESVFQQGWQVIKLYFMVGLPTEVDEDIQAIEDMVSQLRRLKGSGGRRPKINVSVTTFIPKAHTPFQWCQQLSLTSSQDKISHLKRALQKPGIRFKWQNPAVSLLEGLWARGDRRLARLLVRAYRLGCRFDGWTDEFRFDLWQQALDQEGVDIDFFTTRPRDLNEPLPWDHIDVGVNKDYLKSEWEKSMAGTATADCRYGDCNSCGVCDFKTLAPVVFKSCPTAVTSVPERVRPDNTPPRILKLTYTKLDQAQYFGHLELANIFARAIRRAEIPVEFSRGFHPKAKISFQDALPIGMESESETLFLTLGEYIDCQKIVEELNHHLPQGLSVIDGRFVSPKERSASPVTIRYRVSLSTEKFDPAKVYQFQKKPEFVILSHQRNGKTRSVNLSEQVDSMDIRADHELLLVLRSDRGRRIRPRQVLSAVFDLPDHVVQGARIVKLKGGHIDR